MSSVAIDMAIRALRQREMLPGRPEEWGRAFGLTPGQAMRIVRDEERRRARG